VATLDHASGGAYGCTMRIECALRASLRGVTAERDHARGEIAAYRLDVAEMVRQLRAEVRDLKAERDALRLEADGHRAARDARTGERDDMYIALRDRRAAVLAGRMGMGLDRTLAERANGEAMTACMVCGVEGDESQMTRCGTMGSKRRCAHPHDACDLRVELRDLRAVVLAVAENLAHRGDSDAADVLRKACGDEA